MERGQAYGASRYYRDDIVPTSVIERLITGLPGVIAARLTVGAGGVIDNIYVLAAPGRPARSIADDVSNLLAARWGMVVSPGKVAVTQLEEGAVRSNRPRPGTGEPREDRRERERQEHVRDLQADRREAPGAGGEPQGRRRELREHGRGPGGRSRDPQVQGGPGPDFPGIGDGGRPAGTAAGQEEAGEGTTRVLTRDSVLTFLSYSVNFGGDPAPATASPASPAGGSQVFLRVKVGLSSPDGAKGGTVLAGSGAGSAEGAPGAVPGPESGFVLQAAGEAVLDALNSGLPEGSLLRLREVRSIILGGIPVTAALVEFYRIGAARRLGVAGVPRGDDAVGAAAAAVLEAARSSLPPVPAETEEEPPGSAKTEEEPPVSGEPWQETGGL